jgi:hypothetical protein
LGRQLSGVNVAAMVSLDKIFLRNYDTHFVLQDGLAQLLVLVGLIALNKVSGTVSLSHFFGREDKAEKSRPVSPWNRIHHSHNLS